MKKRKREKKQKKYFHKAAIISVLTAIGLGIWAFYMLNQYDDSILDIYGDEQDGYVQVTLEQIEVLYDEGDQENQDKLEEIVSSLDFSTGRFWTLSDQENLLFVKSVSETMRYEGYTENTYFGTNSAEDFLNSLVEGECQHQIIYLDGDRYVASGTVFTWNDQDYTICLLTYDQSILENNGLLLSRNTLIIIILGSLLVFTVTVMVAARAIDHKNELIEKQRKKIRSLNKNVEAMVEERKLDNSYSSKTHSFSKEMIPKFLSAFDKAGVEEIFVAVYRMDRLDEKESFFRTFKLLFDERTVGFRLEENRFALIGMGFDENENLREVLKLIDYHIDLERYGYFSSEQMDFCKQIQSLKDIPLYRG